MRSAATIQSLTFLSKPASSTVANPYPILHLPSYIRPLHYTTSLCSSEFSTQVKNRNVTLAGLSWNSLRRVNTAPLVLGASIGHEVAIRVKYNNTGQY